MLVTKMKSLYKKAIPSKEENKSNNKSRVGKWVIFLLLALDIFVLNVVLMGISSQTNIYVNAAVKYPYECTSLLRENSMLNPNVFQYKKGTSYRNTRVMNAQRNYSNQLAKVNHSYVDERCLEIFKLFNTVSDDVDVRESIKVLKVLSTKLNTTYSQIRSLENQYDTMLFEKIAGQDKSQSIRKDDNVDAEGVKEKYNTLVQYKNGLEGKIKRMHDVFPNIQSVNRYTTYIKKNKEKILKDYWDVQSWGTTKTNLVSFLLTLPLLIIFYILLSRSLRDNNHIKYLIYKNLYIVMLGIGLWYMSVLVYGVIPQTFIASLLGFFAEIQLPIVVYYLLVTLAVLIFTWVIVKIYNRKEGKRLRHSDVLYYRKSLCPECEEKVNYDIMRFCPACQYALKRECIHCGVQTLLMFDYCSDCGGEKK